MVGRLGGGLALLLLGSAPLLATTFTSDTTISALNTNYDGSDIVVTNCTLTVDGSHSFSSLLVEAGGVVTHSFAADGTLQYLTNVTDEPQVLTGTNPAALAHSNVVTTTIAVTDVSGTVLYVNGSDYLLSSPDGVLTDLKRTTNSTIASGQTVLVSYSAVLSTTPVGLNLVVTGNVDVQAGGSINANAKGYGGGNGPGVGHSAGSFADGSGAGYGGLGGNSSSNAPGGTTYGSFTQPPSPGSGGGIGYGGAGGAGGGLIHITANGNLIVDGIICANGANGANSRSGGGSGGGITITASTALMGAGSITANGGNGEPTHGGGGGGGRIILAYVSSEFTGPVTAYGGTGANIGGAGTVYTTPRGQNGLLLIDNGGQAGTNTPVAVSGSAFNVLIQGNARAVPSGNWSLNNLTIASNGLLVASPSSVANGQGTVNLSASGDITIEAGGSIVADGAGSAGGQGQGAGRNFEYPYYSGGGGGYGGAGANGNPTNAYGGLTYGSQTEPTILGSGGGTLNPYSFGGAGGGAIEIYCEYGFIVVDGRISANGNNGSGIGGGGGSGGSIWINGGTLLGGGSITANGGNGADGSGGGGGGGRIQVAPTANMFEGTVSAYGGGGAGWGGAGTVLIQGLNKNPQLVLDNNGHSGTNTLAQSASGTDLVVQGGAICTAQSSVNFANLVLNSNGWLTPYLNNYSNPGNTLNFTFSGNATIRAGAGIIADLAGYVAGQGQGAGRLYISGSSNYCSGAGHGGYGGNSFGSYIGGGVAYDSIMQPSLPGSGGGTSQGNSIGGTGGGVIRLTITGALELDGLISANAGNGIGFAGGGGSGGSIWLAVGALTGGGTIAANGGNGVDGLGGGGGGGMIYIPCSYNGFAGTISAVGGTGANPGGAGQVLIQVNGQSGQLILDNAGRNGPPTPLNVQSMNLTLRNGAVASPAAANLTLGNVLIEPDAWIQIQNSNEVSTLDFVSVTIQPGGGIIADRAGYGAGRGPGAGHYYQQGGTSFPCSGAGHGGYGANALAATLVSGGSPYDSTTMPTQLGSGGGSESPYAIGGAGGGGLQITVSGVLENDGLISANGGNGFGDGGGGGSGGSIYLAAGTLSGAGSILANGGNGVASTGGGGAGGCIAIYPTANLFSGAIAAYGGGGAAWGGAGTVYIQPGAPAMPQLILDNAGNSGASTPIQAATSLGAVVLRNGAVGFQQNSPQTWASLSISSNAWLTALPGNGVILPAQVTAGLVSMTVTGSVTIQAGGGIVTDGVGSTAGQGAGHYGYYGSLYPCSGGGYGGYGGNSTLNVALGGATYTGTASPTVFGSGGGSYSPYSPGGAGGGGIRLIINGTLDDEGIISANGGNGSGLGGGGGSGGSVWLTLGTLLGGGAIRANGGNGVDNAGGGGGGGRISVTFSNNAFTGPITAYGGSGANWGGAGTVYVKTNSQAYAWVIMDNGGHRGTNTTFDASTVSLLIANGAIGQWSSSVASIESLFIRSNSALTFAASPVSQVVEVFGNATIDAGGAISADGTGYGSAQGTGAGVSSTAGICGGGGHGGYGAANPPGYGGAYGSIQSPITAGSGGGNGSGFVQNSPYGGAGGGAVHLEVEGTLTVNGRLSAAGVNGSADSGGGAGGSLWIGAGTLIGSGVISANGGAGSDLGAGGAGGRISIGGFGQSGFGPMGFSGIMTAAGGGGYAKGGAGTIYVANSGGLGVLVTGQLLLVDNGGVGGTNTPISTALGAPSSINLVIQNGAVVTPQTNGNFPILGSLTVGSNGVLSGLPGPSSLDLLVLSNADVSPSGTIIVDGMGYAQGVGPGDGTNRNGYGSGAGYGGIGGASEGGPGGPSYGSAQQPVDFGSGGGFGVGPLAGGSAGGGALRLSVGGILTMDGQVSAEGGGALQGSAGGGSGGSLWVTASTLAGTGQFAVDGGTGDFYGGGGGGAGGRIALYASVNDFSGQLSALGAGGYSSGANGTTVSSSTIAPLQIVSSSPSGIVSNGVSFMDLYFNGALKQGTSIALSFSLTTPSGTLSNGVTSTMISSAHYRVSFPLQSATGSYVFTVATNYITDLYGHSLAQAYMGSFSILLPQVLGMVADAGGHPVPGVTLQAAGLSPATTDINGHYALSFVPGTIFTVQPSQAGMAFVPSGICYTNVTVSTANQNYLAVSSVAPALRTAINGGNLTLSWSAISNVTYQVYSSTDLINWLPYGNPVTANGTAQVLLPTGTNAMMCFRVQASY